MRVAKGAKWTTLYHIVDGKLVVIYEPLRDYKIHNLIAKGWKRSEK